MTDNRSERLRQRRKQTTAPDNGSDTKDSGNSAGNDSNGETPSVKEEQIGTYMYLPESQTKELRRLYNVLKAEYEFEYDEEFEKNRHFYPLIVQYGQENLKGMDASEIRNHLDGIIG